MKNYKKRDALSIDVNAPALSIGVVAKALGVHIRTLRIYDLKGLLMPKRSSFNRRLYSLNDLEKGRFIILLTRNLALNLAGVAIIIKILENMKIEPENYSKYICDIAREIDIDELKQEFNKERLSKRGRKPA